MNLLPLGSIIHSDHLEDVVAAMLGTIGDYDPKVSRFQARFNTLKPTDSAAYSILLDELLISLNRFSPPFSYVGHHPTDPHNWGVWIDLGQLHEAEEKGTLIQVSHHPVRGGKATYALEIGERGVSLYRRRGWQRLWETI